MILPRARSSVYQMGMNIQAPERNSKVTKQNKTKHHCNFKAGNKALSKIYYIQEFLKTFQMPMNLKFPVQVGPFYNCMLTDVKLSISRKKTSSTSKLSPLKEINKGNIYKDTGWFSKTSEG